jgi:predicted nucleic acid-binding protein
MIVLDTNLIAALMRREAPIYDWLNELEPRSVWTNAVSVYETRVGIELLAEGRRRSHLEDQFERLLGRALEDRVLPLDRSASDHAASIAVRQRRAGRPVEIRDVLIAGIVAANEATLATRNTKHFEDIGVSVVNPWFG